MKRILLILALCSAAPALAGETYLGSIVSAAGADTTNGTTATPFVIKPGARLSIQCTAAAYVIGDDKTAVTATRGVTLAADQFFMTKVDALAGKTITITISPIDYLSGILRIAGPAAVPCDVWSRKGDE